MKNLRAILIISCGVAMSMPGAAFAQMGGVFVDGAAAHGEPVRLIEQEEPALLAAQLTAIEIELPPTLTSPVLPEGQRLRVGDLNGDGLIDGFDLESLIESSGPCLGNDCPDLNGDGMVDAEDRAVMMTLLGRQAEDQDGRRLQVGYVDDAPPSLVDAAQFAHLPDGRRGLRLELHSPDAEELRVQFMGPTRSSATELRVYDPASQTVLGPYTAPVLNDDGTWWSPTIFGDTIGLELVRRSGNIPADRIPQITAIAYFYCGAQCHGGPGTTLVRCLDCNQPNPAGLPGCSDPACQSLVCASDPFCCDVSWDQLCADAANAMCNCGTCHNDVTCFPSWASPDGRAVGAMGFVSVAGCFICTGALLNRLTQDFSPVFMTANHCINTPAEANSLEVLWLYETATCNGAPPPFNSVPRTNGSLLLKRHSNTDWTLLGLYEPPSVDFYLGWDTATWSSGGSAAGIHHPAGSWKRISFGSSAGSTDGALFCDPNGTIPCTCQGQPATCFSVNVWDVSFIIGTTQGGSSGSPIFDGDRRVRGTLTGGPSGCEPITASYGRLDQAYANLRYYLDPASPVVFVDGNAGGDPGNNGSSERGTAANPFNTVGEASFCVVSGEELRIAAGTYSEQMTIWRPMTLTAQGGTVVIGD